MSDQPPEFSQEKSTALYPGWPRNMQDVQTRLRQLWDGDIALAQTFWIYYFIFVFILKLLGKSHGALGELFNVLALVWAGFMVKPIMTAADRYPGDKIWAVLAKVAAIVIAIAVLTDLLAY